MMTMEIKDLETFLLIVNTGSFTEAAKALFLTQPGISRRIRHLEEELHCKLFEKVGNQLLITPDGRDLIPLAESALLAVANIQRTFERKQGQFTNITIALSSTLAGTTVSAQYQKLPTVFQNVERFQMRILNDDQLSRSVLRGESDIGIRFFQDDNPQLTCHLLREDPFVLVRAANSRWFPDDGHFSLEKLSRVPWLTLTKLPYFFDPITQVQNITDQVVASLGLELRNCIECYGWTVTKSLVEQDHGIAFLPLTKVNDEVERGQLRILDLPVQPTIPLYGIHRKLDHNAETWQKIFHFLVR